MPDCKECGRAVPDKLPPPLVEVGKTYDYSASPGSNRSPPFIPYGPYLGVKPVRIEGTDFIDQRGNRWDWTTGGWIERP